MENKTNFPSRQGLPAEAPLQVMLPIAGSLTRKSCGDIKYLLFLFIGLFFGQQVMAQKSDTLLYYLNVEGKITKDKDSAEFAEYVLPYDKLIKLYPVYIYYSNGKKKLLGAVKTKPRNNFSFLLEGSCTNYYPNGKRKLTAFYNDGKIVGDYEEYYPDGKLYCVKSAVKSKPTLLIECRDSTGNVLAENGKGHWIVLNKYLNEIISEGNIADSSEDGEWRGSIDDTGRFLCNYQRGKLISGTGYDATGKAYQFTTINVDPMFKGGNNAFKAFLRRNTITSLNLDAHPRMYGTLNVFFTVEKNGQITNVGVKEQYVIGRDEVLNDYYNNMCMQVIKAVKLSPPWIPGTIYGIPARLQVTVPVEFNTEH
jgi:antitoxin component YwqK of YwqJK toxin-antitoxin module